MTYQFATGVTKWSSVASEPITINTWVHVTPTGAVITRSDLNGTVDGLTLSGGNTGEKVSIVSHGRLSLLDWTSATGSTLLVPGSKYFITDSGKMSTTAPSVGYVIQVGHAQTQNDFLINVQPSVKL